MGIWSTITDYFASDASEIAYKLTGGTIGSMKPASSQGSSGGGQPAGNPTSPPNAQQTPPAGTNAPPAANAGGNTPPPNAADAANAARIAQNNPATAGAGPSSGNNPNPDADKDDGLGMRDIWKNIGKMIAAFAMFLVHLFTGNWGELGKDLGKLMGGLVGAGSAIGDVGKTLVNDVKNTVVNTLENGVSNVGNWVSGAVHNIGQKIGWIAPPITGATVVDAAQKHGADPTALLTISKMESNWNPNAKNRLSSAVGLFQTITPTWLHFGVKNPLDPVENSRAGAELWVDNKNKLSRSLGRGVNNAEVYLAHMFGDGGAAGLLKGGNNMTAIDALRQGGDRNAEKSVENNLSADDKKRNPGWRQMTAMQLTNVIADRYYTAENNVATQNYALLHNGQQPPAAAPPPVQVAAAPPPVQAPPAPATNTAEQHTETKPKQVAENKGLHLVAHKPRDYRHSMPATPPEQEVAEAKPKTVPIDKGRKPAAKSTQPDVNEHLAS